MKTFFFTTARGVRDAIARLVRLLRDSPPTPDIRRVHHLFLLTVGALVTVCVLWSLLARMDVVSVAAGKVIPKGRVRTIQHRDGGIVREILVREGDRVREGHLLLTLEKTESSSDVTGGRAIAAALAADIARLEAEIGGTGGPSFPAAFESTYPAMAREGRELFRARRQELESALAGLQEQITQRERDINSATERIKSGGESLALTEKQFAISSELLAEHLTSQYKHLELEREVSRLRGRLAEDRVALERARSSLTEARQKLREKRQTFLAGAADDLKKARMRLQEMNSRQEKYEDTLQRTELRSPVPGIVKTIHIVTRGGVIAPGMAVMDIVPVEERLVVEAHLPIDDIGYVRVGQRTTVRLASRDSRRFGKLAGRVFHVSPDALTSRDNTTTFYAIQVEMEKAAFENGPHRYQLYPGILVAVSIHIGQRTVFAYLLEPFFNSLSFTFQER